ncbi:hypothetical protein DSAG12_01507 [Promethearchaeum syntrophicum]|uniref:Uncharacterized protein n=1 Tax=Promethearchaeum syntrophicum TaxID=2594042 RepID=A0A5B9DAC3_9ARCH|nr:hypothetical protein [Candidatus Prometheoarchaeum syntrophicum]QEE15680.1 hypothetical protein DSAG12_01507 [Candidatus Prometheoarchaeum syntrophicum]
MLPQRRAQLRVALHIDVILNLIILSAFFFARGLNIFAYMVIIFCPFYAYGAFKINSTINKWVSIKLDIIDTALIKWIIKNKKLNGNIFFRKFLPHNDSNKVFLDIPMPIDSLQFKKKKKTIETWDIISEEDVDPLHINKTTLDLAQQLIQNEKALTEEELERLYSEGNYKERELLEANLPPDHPILLKIHEKLKIEISNGLSILK